MNTLRKLRIGLCLGAQVGGLILAGCRSSSASDQANSLGAVVSPESPQVKPAAARETELIAEPEPEPEAAELPRGVSAPKEVAPTPEPTAQAEPASLPPSKPSPKPKPTEPPAAPAPVAKPKPAAPPPIAKPAAPPPIAKPAAPPPIAKPKPPAVAKAPARPTPPPPVQQPVAPEPIATAPVAAPTPKVSVLVPQTDHVRVEVPAGLQHWLDEDDRMRPWLSKAMSVADSCYAKVRADNASASGEISFRVTMHTNARPSGSVGSVSSPISGIVMCATTRLMGVKMPLFTGTEGESYTVRVRFQP